MLFRKKLILNILSLIICVPTMLNTSFARSVYVIIDRDSTIRAYKINGEKIEEQTDVQNLDDHGGAVGLDLDPDSATMFVTYEGSNIIEMVNAKTMISEENPVTVPGASNLSGITFDQSKQKLYVMKRQENRLYVYLWNPVTRNLTLEGDTYKTLENISPYPSGAYGIALDESKERLYVTDATNTVKYYDTSDPNSTWTCQGTIDIVVNSNPREAVGIAIDPNRNYLYTGTFTGTDGDHKFLVRTDIADINNPDSTEHNVGAYVIGIAADEDTDLVYVTTKHEDIEVYNTGTFPSDPCYIDTNDISQPADIVVRGDVSYMPEFPMLTLVKEDDIVDCVVPYDEIIYTITYDANGDSDTNVVITDYLPVEVDPNNPSDPNYNSEKHIYTWQIGTLSPGDSNSFTLKITVNESAEPSGTITNHCEIEGDEYRSYATLDTDVCCWGSDIIYVDENATSGSNSGTSWQNAYIDLQDALDRADSGCGSQIWVAEGTYKPTGGEDRMISFDIINDVDIYGGFPTGGGKRNPGIYETILSGNIYEQDESDDNSYHVVKCENVNNVIFDGFTIKEGYANYYYPGYDGPDFRGGGIYNYNSSSLTINNCIFKNNTAIGEGGGLYNNSSNNLIVSNCVFSENNKNYTFEGVHGGGIYNEDVDSSSEFVNNIFYSNLAGSGGGMYNKSSSPTINNCIFYANQGIDRLTNPDTGYGGGMYNIGESGSYSSPNLVNCTFSANYAGGYDGDGGGLYNDSYISGTIITNCIFWGNIAGDDGSEIYTDSYSHRPTISYSDINECLPWDKYVGINGGGNIDSDPCFVNPDANNYHLNYDSPCIDVGDPCHNAEPNETDIDGENRRLDGDANGTIIVDMGADEYYWSPADFDKNEIVNLVDYAMLANAWKSSPGGQNYSDIYDLEDDDLIDCNDLALFCEDWLWASAWGQTMESMMMGGGMGESMGKSVSQGVSLTKFVYPTAEVKSIQPEPLSQNDIEKILLWLEELWLDPEVRKSIDKDVLLKFTESIKSELE